MKKNHLHCTRAPSTRQKIQVVPFQAGGDPRQVSTPIEGAVNTPPHTESSDSEDDQEIEQETLVENPSDQEDQDNLPSDEESSETEESSESEDSVVNEDIVQNPVIIAQPAIMAGHNQAKRQFMVPTKYKGTLDEDASEWIQRYESTGLYNRWEPEDLAANLGMYLEDSARKWFLCTTLPEQWEDTPEIVGVAAAQDIVEVLAVAAIIGIKTRFLQEFQRENYALFQEAKLRNRDQGVEEETSRYYYDVIDFF